MQLTRTIFFDSAIFIEKRTVENRLWAKSQFLWAKKNASWMSLSYLLDELSQIS